MSEQSEREFYNEQRREEANARDEEDQRDIEQRESLGSELPKQQARIRRCLQNGREIGPAGAFYCVMAEDLLKRADKAVMEQDILAMIGIFQEMREFSE